MSQTITALTTQATVPPSDTGGFTDQIYNIYSNPTIRRVIEAVAVPLSILATLFLHPYLILDPTTTLVGVGCAVLVNTVALNCLYPMIPYVWTTYCWDKYWPVSNSTPEAIPTPETAPTLPLTPETEPLLDPLAKYQISLQELNRAIKQLKEANVPLVSMSQEQKADLVQLQQTESDQKTLLLERAAIKTGLIENLIRHPEVTEICPKDTRTLKMALASYKAVIGTPQEVENAKDILISDLKPISSELSAVFSERRLNLSRTTKPFYISARINNPTHITKNDKTTLNNGLQQDKDNLLTVTNNLTNTQTKIEELTLRMLKKANDIESKKKERGLLLIDLESATSALKQIEEELKKRTTEKDDNDVNILEIEKAVSPIRGTPPHSKSQAAAKPSKGKNVGSYSFPAQKASEPGQLEKLKSAAKNFEKEITLLKTQRNQASVGQSKIEVQLNRLQKEIEEIELELSKLSAQIITASGSEKIKNEQKKQELTDRIALAEKVIAFIPIMALVNEISKLEKDPPSSQTILSAYTEAVAQRKKRETTSPQDIKNDIETLNKARDSVWDKAKKEQTAFESLSTQDKLLSQKKIEDVREARHFKVISKAMKVKAYYDQKIKDLCQARSLAALDTIRTKAEIQTLSREILEGKIGIAVAKIEADSFADARGTLKEGSLSLEVDEARLHLAKYRLLRHRKEEEWKISQEADAISEGKLLIDRIEEEKQLTLKYFESKLRRDAQEGSSLQGVKASFAILNLILDQVYVEISIRDMNDRKTFNAWERIKDLFEKFMNTENAQFIKNSLCFESWIEKTQKDGKTIGETTVFSLSKLPSFLNEVNNKSKPLLKNAEKNNSELTPIRALIGNKIALIQLALGKPFPSEELDRDKKSYESARYTYQNEKYLEKNTYASKVALRTQKKDPYTKAQKRQNDLDSAARNVATANTERVNARNIAQAERDAALRNRVQAIETYGWVEKLSYLIPSAALWALYQFSPLLSCISLSLRVSQNIVFIGSATHLFVQSFFRNPLSNIDLRNAHPTQTQPTHPENREVNHA